MALTWGDIARWDEGHLLDASETMKARRQRVLEVMEGLTASKKNYISMGQTADAVRGNISRLHQQATVVMENASAAMMALAQAHGDVADVRTRVIDCHQYASVNRIILDPVTGEVDDNTAELMPPPGSSANAYRSVNYQEILHRQTAAAQLRRDVEATLALAKQADEDLQNALKRIESHDRVRKYEDEADHSPGLSNLPQSGWSVTEVSMWWSTLSEEDKKWLLDKHYKLLGNLDGIEFSWRDQANRKILMDEISVREKEMAEIEEMRERIFKENSGRQRWAVSTEDRMKLERALNLKKELEDLYQIRTTLNERTNTTLVTLDMSGERTKAAVAIGDLDRADHVATFVPGMGTTVRDSLEGYVDDADRIRDHTEDALTKAGRRNEKAATVAWLGYDAPADNTVLSVVGTGLAEQGAKRLTSFVEGMQSTHALHGNQRDSHLTLIGHSYGSTTSGMAAAHVKPGIVDDLVLFGSPGSGVQSVDEYNITGQQYVSGVPDWWNDAVQGIGTDYNFGRNPLEMDGFEHLSNESPKEPSGWFNWLNPFDRHGTDTYLHEDSKILEDISSVVAETKGK